MQKYLKQTNGQIIVLLALLFVVILAFVSLAIDYGIIMTSRRSAQSGADSAALAGAGQAVNWLTAAGIKSSNLNCSNATLLQTTRNAALEYALKNGYTIEQTLANKNGVLVACDQAKKYIDITVMITTTAKTFFTSLFVTQPIKNEVTAIARVYPIRSAGMGYAFVSLDPECGPQDGINISGSGTLTIHNSGIFSNCRIDGTGSINVITDVISGYVGLYRIANNVTFSPTPTQSSITLPTPVIPTPNCLALPDMGSSTHGGPILPGRYSKIAVTGGDPPLLMSSGLYCMYGDFSAIGTASVTGNGITLYMAAGQVKVTGTGSLSLTASSPPGTNGSIPGVLIYMPASNPDQISMTGSGSSNLKGTVYAPTGTFDISGSANNMGLQVIAWKIDITGSGTMDINYDEAFFYTVPPRLDLLR